MLEQIGANRCFEGQQLRFKHRSQILDCDMQFSIYLPPGITKKIPLLWWLSGLTCNDENFVQKSGAQRICAELGIAFIAPDTSPRGDNVPDDPNKSYDLGLGAGFYLNASRDPWRKHYRMYDYLTRELPELITSQFSFDPRAQSISGHSMGGHGALTIAFKNSGKFRSVSAFAPICAPTQCPWGKKAFSNYLGSDENEWQQYDASYLIKSAQEKLPILIDQGDKDNFLEEQLLPEKLIQAAEEAEYPIEYKLRIGYDHSYFFIASFIEEHLRFHEKYLKA